MIPPPCGTAPQGRHICSYYVSRIVAKYLMLALHFNKKTD